MAYSERVRGTGRSLRIDPMRDFGEILVLPFCLERDGDYALDCCRLAASRDFPAYRTAGIAWFHSDVESTAYNHAQEPNGPIPDAISFGAVAWGIATARSFHPGGVNGLMADGSVRYCRNTTARAVWRALGTRHGAELVE
jgi:prepilin-type processing-associated H-X9-DG protein